MMNKDRLEIMAGRRSGERLGARAASARDSRGAPAASTAAPRESTGQEARRRDALVDAAQTAGKIAAGVSATAWREAFDRDPDGTERLLTASEAAGGLAPGKYGAATGAAGNGGNLPRALAASGLQGRRR